MAELRPVALPPAERTIGQLVAESIQFYGAHFWDCLVLGVPAAAVAVVVLLSQSVLVFILRGFGNTASSVALFLASVVLSPLLFVGGALLYVDQAARVEVE